MPDLVEELHTAVAATADALRVAAPDVVRQAATDLLLGLTAKDDPTAAINQLVDIATTAIIELAERQPIGYVVVDQQYDGGYTITGDVHDDPGRAIRIARTWQENADSAGVPVQHYACALVPLDPTTEGGRNG